MLNIAINGFGRIGRAALKIIQERKGVKVIAINDLSGVKMGAYLLAYDSVFGRYSQKVSVKKGSLEVGEDSIAFLSEPDPAKLPWKEMGIDLVLECTGVFETKEKNQGHLDAGAKKVIISSPPKDETPIFCMGCNEKKYRPEKDHIVSNGSCTTNCLAPIAKVLNDEIGIDKALMTTIHSYTASQSLVDASVGDERRSRAAALNLSPSTTGAAIAVTRVLPELAGKFDGMAVRVPTPCVSLVDLVAKLRRNVTIEKIANIFIGASRGEMKGILAVESLPLVSSDFIGNKHSAIVDLEEIMVLKGDMVKVIAWYDNEWGYSERLVDLAVYLGKFLK